ncbi:N-acetyltransferase [Acetobacter sacchari]|uniref:N-acetyltransferase n=1 Tax=Acetobacter sacchari TaxID=2661687 RepID=A0ABS3LRM7_9PROT|nr:GNAT family N-acetyltransferase [Acetobacter sacchari]MBO1358559.1 N-acetyltransferase [Acetobacter sacchari]
MTIVDNVSQNRFETIMEGHLATLIYERSGDALVIQHTLVPDALGGRGVGSALVSAAVDAARAEKRSIVSHCSFATVWLKRHGIETRPG